MSTILFLSGAFVKDVEIKPESIMDVPPYIFDDEDEESYLIPTESKKENIPQFYTGIANWPVSTGLRCWHCDCIFEERPKTLPISFDRIGTKKDGTAVYRMPIVGYFDTWCCAAAWNKTYSPAHTQEDRINLLIRLFEDFNPGKTVDMIPIAPERTEMTQWAGENGIPPSEFYKKCNSIIIPYIREKGSVNIKFEYGSN